MTTHPLKQLIDLVSFDQQRYTHSKEVAQLTQDVEELDQQIDLIAQELQHAKNHWMVMRKEVDAKELEMKSFDVKEQEVHHKLDTLHNPKEYAPLKKELEYIRTQRHEYETVLLEAWHNVETAERDYKAHQAIYENKLETINQTLDEKSKKLKQLQEQLRELDTQHDTYRNAIPQEWLTVYERMHAKVINPVVPIHDDHCSACFCTVPQQDIMALRRKKLLQCKECYRLLYLPSILTESPEPAVEQ